MDNEQQKKEHQEALRLLNLGARLLEQGQGQDAIHFLEQALELDPESVPVLINLGGAYVMTGRHKKARPLLEAARDHEPHNPMIWLNLGAAYLGNPALASPEQQMQAIAAFEKAIELNPAIPNAHYNLGLIFVDRGDDDLAAAAFRQAIRVNRLDRDARSWLRKLENPGKQGGDDD